MHQYPEAQPHPSTKEHDVDWNKEIQPRGPVGLLIESLVWHGLAIDQDLRIRQKNEPAIDILNMPYQSLKKLVLQAAARARTRAEWKRNTGSTTSNEILEIDRDLSQVSKVLNDLEKGIVAASMMGGTQAKCETAKHNIMMSSDIDQANIEWFRDDPFRERGDKGDQWNAGVQLGHVQLG